MSTPNTWTTIAAFPGLLVAALSVAGCREALGPAPGGSGAAERATFAAAAAPGAPSGIALDVVNGTLNQQGIPILIKGFNPTNPHVGDAIVATFFWLGPATITDVTDVQTDASFTPVGNTYHLVDSRTVNGVSMATYVATNVRNFPDPNPDPTVVLAVRATMSEPVPDGGLMLTSWSGVAADFTMALGQVQSASGASTEDAAVGPGSITVNPGALALGVMMASPPAGRDAPLGGFTQIADVAMTDASFGTESAYLVSATASTVAPTWFWGFSGRGGAPVTWMATALALNPPPHLAFTVPPKTTLPLLTMPAVQVAVVDAGGNRVTNFSGQVTIAIGHNGGVLAPGTLSGTKTVTVVNGVATFSDLSIDQPGNGYTLVVSTSGATGAESPPFNIGAF